ncbi:N-acetylmuramoyl-L-alanine amidase [Desulfotruncus alcoholivorax]|uniref:N-acetylmuramoyl-L-alanine amidase n=1 Tax=Desulfotruncus alcoholivorax TaxID=265477 RepID=UPI0003F8D0E0|nr:N-acetylmuramoyl-L-alanine amidase [Desulfotruncus alcoholivorax]
MNKIVIDPGHGGSDPGAVYKGYYEKNFTLEIAQSAVDFLEKIYDAEIYLTRKADESSGLSERSVFANNLKADLFVSIHINAGGGTGFESYIYTNAGSKTKAIQNKIHDFLSQFYKSQGFSDRGEKKANFSVLRNTKMPAVLLENLFIDNPKDLAQLLRPGFIQSLGVIIGEGIAKAADLTPKSITAPDQQPKPDPSPPAPAPTWKPEEEIERLKNEGLIANKHSPNDLVNWGEFAAVINRLLGKISNR